MGAEVLLYGYGLVCASMLVFNLLDGLHLRSDDRRMERRTGRLRRQVEKQLAEIREASDGISHPIQVSHLTWMRRRLSRINELLAFDQLMEELEQESAVYEAYIRQLQPVFLQLATVYWKRESTQAAYYCYFLASTNSAGTWRWTSFSRSSSPI